MRRRWYSTSASMKLVIAFVHADDAATVLGKLQRGKIPSTALESRGGFLRRGNATILSAVEENDVERVLTILRAACKPRAEHVDTTFAGGSVETIGLPGSAEVPVGGATVLLLDVARVVKI